jgi:PTH1 family peptidyl-tRNA hydrolase
MGLFRRSRESGDGWIVVGLGNPGERYAGNRHNVGAMVVDELLTRTGTTLKRHKSGCRTAEARIGGERVVIARPTSYMNESGACVRALVRWYKVSLEHVVVVYDEIDIPFGEVRIKVGGGTAGHNGVRSVVAHFKDPGFVRIRVGVSRPRGNKDPADYVLEDFSSAERKELGLVIDTAAGAVEKIVELGVGRAMNEVNTKQR